jgi:hypothetical protein
LAVILNIEYLGGGSSCVFFLSPLLLLLTRDNYVFTTLEDKNRYFPILAACSGFLGFVSVHTLWLRRVLGLLGILGVSVGQQSSWYFLLRNTALLAIQAPVQWSILAFFQTYEKQSQYWWLMLLPLNFLTALSDLTSVQLLSVLGMGGCIAEFYCWFRWRAAAKSKDTI